LNSSGIELETQIIDEYDQPIVKISFPSGDYYEGSFYENEGQGIYVKSSGDFYRVNLKHGKFSRIRDEEEEQLDGEVVEDGEGVTKQSAEVATEKPSVEADLQCKKIVSLDIDSIPLNESSLTETQTTKNKSEISQNLGPLFEKRITLKLNQISCTKLASALKNLP
jgi:hypothetical protein